MGAGFELARDVSSKAQPPADAREKQCWHILKERAGTEIKSRTTRPNGLLWCNAFWLLQEALRPATGKQFDRTDLAGLYFSMGPASSLLALSLRCSQRTERTASLATRRSDTWMGAAALSRRPVGERSPSKGRPNTSALQRRNAYSQSRALASSATNAARSGMAGTETYSPSA